jgi:phytanoyl-CoA hydroxylase
MLGKILPRTFTRLLGRKVNNPAVQPADETNLMDLTEEQKRSFHDNGFIILPGFFSKNQTAAIKKHLDHLWETRADNASVVISCYNGKATRQSMRFQRAPDNAKNLPYTLLDLHLEDELIRDVCAALPLVRIMAQLLGANPIVCNSLLFGKGSQQDAHFDTFFMPSKTTNMMAASWIAIDTVTATNGPLYYYPKSHLIEPYRFSHGQINAIFSELKEGAGNHISRIIEEYQLRREVFMPQEGDMLIWHAQLLHGGSEILDFSETRRSLVTHYWTEVDWPEPEQRIDLGDGRWILKRDHQHVRDEETLSEIDSYLATFTVTDAMRSAVPDAFNARDYLARNQDLMRAGANPWMHYAEHGRREGRVW